MTALAHVPELDLADVHSDDPVRLDRAARAVAEGYGRLGAVAVAGHGLSPAVDDAAHAAFLAFCGLPEPTKARWHRRDLWHQRGWTPPLTERAVVAGGAPDFKECFFAAPLPLDASARPLWPELLCENVWPDAEIPRLAPAFTAAGTALHDAGLGVLTAAERALALDRGALASLTDGAAHVTRALRYLPMSEEQAAADVPWGEEHTDFNLLTVLGGSRFLDPNGRTGTVPDGRSGLYLRLGSGPGEPGTLARGVAPQGRVVSQVGQQLEILSGGRFRATPHVIRAPATPGWSRSAFAHFVHVHPMRVLTPVAACATPAAVRAYHPPALAGLWALKTLVDIGLAPPEALGWLGTALDARLGEIRGGRAEPA
jgi:isopenicillin N synthase-like dioxygenase